MSLLALFTLGAAAFAFAIWRDGRGNKIRSRAAEMDDAGSEARFEARLELAARDFERAIWQVEVARFTEARAAARRRGPESAPAGQGGA